MIWRGSQENLTLGLGYHMALASGWSCINCKAELLDLALSQTQALCFPPLKRGHTQGCAEEITQAKWGAGLWS